VKVLGVDRLLVVSGSRDQRIAAIAAHQRGRVARRQLLAAGITEGMIAAMLARGAVYRRHAGVYAVGHLAPVEYGEETAALLAAGESAVLSHESAAALWGLRPALPPGAPVHVSLPRPDSAHRRGIIAHRTRTLLPRDIRIREHLPVTSPARTVVDIAGSLTERERERAVDEALVSRMATRAQVEDVLARNPTRPAAQHLRALLGAREQFTITRSEAEERFLALTRDAALPAPELNVRLHGFEVDFLWRAERVVVEVDGFSHHGSRSAFERDRAKAATLAAVGFTVIRVTWVQIAHEAFTVIANVAAALAWARARAA
jgi:very-short-patch-repair endonuclease